VTFYHIAFVFPPVLTNCAIPPMDPTPCVTNLLLSVVDASGEVDAHWDSLYKQGAKTYEIETQLNPLNNDPMATHGCISRPPRNPKPP